MTRSIWLVLFFFAFDSHSQSGDYVHLSKTFIPKLSNTRLAMGTKSDQTAKPDPGGKIPQISVTAPKSKKKKLLTYIAIKGPNVEGEQRFNKSDVLKIAMDVVIESGKYRMIFSEPKTFREAGFQFLILRLNIDDQKRPDGQKGYHLKFSMINAKTGKIAEYAEAQFILDRRLLFTERKLLYQLVYGKKAAAEKMKDIAPYEKPKEEDKKEEEKSKDDKKEDSKKEKVDKDESEKELKKKEKKRKKPKKKKVTKIPPQDKKIAKLARDPIAEEPQPPKTPKENEAPKTPPAPTAEADGAKKGKGKGPEAKPPKKPDGEKLSRTKKKISEDDESEEDEAPEAKPAYNEPGKKDGGSKGDKVAKKEEKKEDPPKDQEISQFDLQDDPPAGERGNVTPGGSFIKTYKFSFDYIGQQIKSVDRISVTNNFTFVGPKLYGRFQFDEFNKDAFSVDFLFTNEIKSVEYDVPGLKRLGVNYEKDTVFLPLVLSAGLRFENQVFVNLPKEGLGLKVSENQIVWMVLGGKIEFTTLSRQFEFGAKYFNTFIGSTDFGGDDSAAITIDGTKFVWYADFEVLKHFHLSYSAHSASMQSQGLKNLKNTETSTEIALTYRMGGD